MGTFHSNEQFFYNHTQFDNAGNYKSPKSKAGNYQIYRGLEKQREEEAQWINQPKKMSKSCKGLAMELVKCLSESDCVKVEHRSYRECAKEKSPLISSECVGLRETYFNCKRGQVDMRARIRGNKGY
ncbi:OLC1v1014476C1 [Oldenlandia corymbosa var. corymbosa]|uniref:OLC1v1014476C1 n=1 Tax=Oldenlandia corymbosa var. corymbosa TaxID=529605 RepID=A0AAV1E0S2_OLDCO|nr:OLC1v1014476C1 [Oldenlandia corymbosa var. corymbosa]